MLVYSKAAVGLALCYFANRAFTPPHELSAKDSRRDSLLRVGAIAQWLAFRRVAVPLLILFKYFQDPHWSITQPWTELDVLAVFLTAGSLGLRLWAMHKLGRQFTFEVGIRQDHRLVRTGPYSILRHPSYTGALLSMPPLMYFLGFRGWWWTILLIPVYLGTVFGVGLRIRNEESVLHEHFGQAWDDHCKKTWRLIPFLF